MASRDCVSSSGERLTRKSVNFLCIVYHSGTAVCRLKPEIKQMTFAAVVDARIKYVEEHYSDRPEFKPCVVTVRVPEDMKLKIDLISRFTGWNRQETLRAMLSSAVDEGVKALSADGPAFTSELKAMLAALEAGESPDLGITDQGPSL